MTRPPNFIYFDLGRVLVDFDVDVMCRQMAQVAGCDAALVKQVVFAEQLQTRYETGLISTRDFYEEFCRQTGTRADYNALLHAASDIFTLRATMLPVIASLHRRGYRLGILSNTCEAHWQHCCERFWILNEFFELYALSFEIEAVKPEAAIFHEAARMAETSPQEIFFCDDTPGHVEGAKAVGWDAVHYVDAPQLVDALQERGVQVVL